MPNFPPPETKSRFAIPVRHRLYCEKEGGAWDCQIQKLVVDKRYRSGVPGPITSIVLKNVPRQKDGAYTEPSWIDIHHSDDVKITCSVSSGVLSCAGTKR